MSLPDSVAGKKPAVGAATKPYRTLAANISIASTTAAEDLDDGERVNKITEHPAFQNCARTIARLYDALHKDHKGGKNILTMPTERGGFTHRYFKAPTALRNKWRAATRSPSGRCHTLLAGLHADAKLGFIEVAEELPPPSV